MRRRWLFLGSLTWIAACQAASFDLVLEGRPPLPHIPATGTETPEETMPPAPSTPVPTSTIVSGSVPLDLCVPLLRTIGTQADAFRVVVPSFPGDVGSQVLLHQTQHENPSTAGTYKTHLVGAIGTSSGNIVLKFPEPLATLYHSDTSTRRAQACVVPTFDQLTVSSLATLSAAKWDGSRGGVLALRAANVTLGGEIDMSGRGFRSGLSAESDGQTFDGTDTSNPLLAAGKGEGFDPSLYGRFGRGAASSGGGGGNAGNGAEGAGGGGSGFGAGGNGGGPTERAGIGGAVPAGGTGRFGGGGGGGHSVTAASPGSGGAGGGLVVVEVSGTFDGAGTAAIHAQGIDGEDSSGNGAAAGGGGGGGVVRLGASQCTGTFAIRARGGNGGGTGGANPASGGGGGGGGTIRIGCGSGSATTLDRGPGSGGSGVDTDANGQDGGDGSLVPSF